MQQTLAEHSKPKLGNGLQRLIPTHQYRCGMYVQLTKSTVQQHFILIDQSFSTVVPHERAEHHQLSKQQMCIDTNQNQHTATSTSWTTYQTIMCKSFKLFHLCMSMQGWTPLRKTEHYQTKASVTVLGTTWLFAPHGVHCQQVSV